MLKQWVQLLQNEQTGPLSEYPSILPRLEDNVVLTLTKVALDS